MPVKRLSCIGKRSRIVSPAMDVVAHRLTATIGAARIQQASAARDTRTGFPSRSHDRRVVRKVDLICSIDHNAGRIVSARTTRANKQKTKKKSISLKKKTMDKHNKEIQLTRKRPRRKRSRFLKIGSGHYPTANTPEGYSDEPLNATREPIAQPPSFGELNGCLSRYGEFVARVPELQPKAKTALRYGRFAPPPYTPD